VAHVTASADRRSVMRWPVLALFVLLPLQWFAVGTTPLGQGRLHQVAILGFAACVLVRYRTAVYAPVLSTGAVFVIANLYMIGASAATFGYQGKAPMGAIQQALYLVAFLAIAGFWYLVASGREPGVVDTLRVAAIVLCVSLLTAFSIAMLVNGVNPISVLSRTIASADPEIFQKEVFKSAFAGFGLEDDMVQGNLRHEIFGSVLLTMLISTWAMRVGSTPTARQQTLYRVSMGVGAFLLALSLSRSVLIAASTWPLLAAVRTLRRGELSTRQLSLLFGAVIALGTVLVSGLGLVVYNRFFTDTTGYEARAGNYGDAVTALPQYWLTGGYDTEGVSSHNFVVDTMLRAGIFAAIPAAVIVGTVVVVFFLLGARLYRLPSWMLPVAVALALPLVRLGTSGGGTIPPVEWLALSFVVGVLAAWRRGTLIEPAARSRPVAVGA